MFAGSGDHHHNNQLKSSIKNYQSIPHVIIANTTIPTGITTTLTGPLSSSAVAAAAAAAAGDAARWSINSTQYQNAPNDSVDWGALAKQWIEMAEVLPPDRMPEAPPPPPINIKDYEEKGEAPMEVDREDELILPQQQSGQQHHWNTGWSGNHHNTSSGVGGGISVGSTATAGQWRNFFFFF